MGVSFAEGIFSTMFDSMTDYVVLFSIDKGPCFRIEMANQSYYNETASRINCDNTKSFSTDYSIAVHQLMLDVYKTKKRMVLDCEYQMQSGKHVTRISVSPLWNEKGELTNLLLIIECKENQNQQRSLASLDPLTNVPNRRLFQEHLDKAVNYAKASNKMLAVLFLDFDHFKWVNDSLDQEIADELLRQLCNRIKGLIRDVDLLARLGDYEFAVILVDIDSELEVELKAQKIVEALREPWIIRNEVFVSTASIGIAMYPQDGDSSTLIKHANQALFSVKNKGRNNYKFFNPRGEKRYRDIVTPNALWKALQRNEFYLSYQPKFNIQTGEVTGIEALIRWHHPEYGLIQPDKFIPLAESIRVIEPITEWVLQEACSTMKCWQEKGLKNVEISVNVSGSHFNDDSFVEMILEVLNKTGLDPKSLVLEITERTIAENFEKTQSILDQLKKIGVSIAIDDFGVGFSSLSYIKHFKIDALKIDKSFVRDVPTDFKDVSIIKTVITLAKNLGFYVVAEGIETLEQLEFLKENGCDIGQGYYYSKPLRKEEFESFMFQKLSSRPSE